MSLAMQKQAGYSATIMITAFMSTCIGMTRERLKNSACTQTMFNWFANQKIYHLTLLVQYCIELHWSKCLLSWISILMASCWVNRHNTQHNPFVNGLRRGTQSDRYAVHDVWCFWFSYIPELQLLQILSIWSAFSCWIDWCKSLDCCM